MNYFLDNLPVGLAHTFYNINTKKIKYNTGIPIGFVKDGQTYINNYYRINIELNAINIPVLKIKQIGMMTMNILISLDMI